MSERAGAALAAMSRRSARSRKSVNYIEAAADDDDAAAPPQSDEQQESQPDSTTRRGRGRRGKAAVQHSDDSQTAQPATQRGEAEQPAAEEAVGAEVAPAVEARPPHELLSDSEQQQPEDEAAEASADSQVAGEAVDSQETQSDDVKDDAEKSDSDEEWNEKPPKQSAEAADGRDAIVLSDDEVDSAFDLPKPTPAARMKAAQREALSGSKRKPRAAAAKKSSKLLRSVPATSSASQRSAVTVSRDDAITLEDSLDAAPTRPAISAAAPPSTAASRPAFATPSSTSTRKPNRTVNGKLPFEPQSSSNSHPPKSSQAANLASMRVILGTALPDSTLLRFLLSANYNCERAISNLLDSPQLLNATFTPAPPTAAAPFNTLNNSQQQQQTTPQPVLNGKKRSRRASDDDAEYEEEEAERAEEVEDEDEQRWSDKLTAGQPTEESEERRESEKEMEKADEEEETQAVITWDRKLLVVLRVEASCTTEGTKVVILDEAVTFRDQSRDTYHQRMLRSQLQQQAQSRNRKQTKQLRKDLRAEKKKEHRILRFVPSAHLNALEIGTLPRAVSDVLVPLFDRQLIDISAVVTAPCPLKFDLLSRIPLLLSVYALPALFRLKREVRVETKGFLGKVVSTAADQQLNPVDTFLALLNSFHIKPVSSSIREEGTEPSQTTLRSSCNSLHLDHSSMCSFFVLSVSVMSCRGEA